MAGGLPQPAVNKIPVKQIAVETYLSVYEHRHRIVRWAIVPLFLCTVLVMVQEGLRSSRDFQVYFEAIILLVLLLLVILITVPFQVAIHRLIYPGFDFDRGSYGPSLEIIHKYYFLYTILLSALPIIVLSALYTIIIGLDLFFGYIDIFFYLF